jgi:hypothetical protein
MSEVNVKKELETLDRNDFEAVCSLVDKIIEDIWVTAVDDDSLHGLMQDYMVDLINPDHLDFKQEIYFDLGEKNQ